jgi:hypothetical protein
MLSQISISIFIGVSLVLSGVNSQILESELKNFVTTSEMGNSEESVYGMSIVERYLFAQIIDSIQDINYVISDSILPSINAQSNNSASNAGNADSESNQGKNLTSPTKTPGSGKASDVIPPRVISFSPANGTIRIPLLPTITATFSEQIQGSSVTSSTFKVIDSAGNIIPGMVTKQAPGIPPTIIMFKPTSQLESSKLYSAIITTGVKDLAGNPLADITKWYFTTTPNQAATGTFQPPKDTVGTFQPPKDTSEPSADTVPPRVVNVKPPNGSTGVPVTSSIRITFSEPILYPVSATSFMLTTLGTTPGTGPFGELPIPAIVNVPGTATLSTDGRTAEFRPAQPLIASKYYYYSLTGVIDTSGNPVAPIPKVEGSFTTGSQ